jgi:hypothetical protein
MQGCSLKSRGKAGTPALARWLGAAQITQSSRATGVTTRSGVAVDVMRRRSSVSFKVYALGGQNPDTFRLQAREQCGGTAAEQRGFEHLFQLRHALAEYPFADVQLISLRTNAELVGHLHKGG